MLLKVLGYGQRVLRVPLHAQVQRFDALKQQEGIEGRQCRSGIAQPLHAGLENKC